MLPLALLAHHPPAQTHVSAHPLSSPPPPLQAAVDSLGMLAAALRALTYAGSARRVAPGGEGEPTVCWHAVAEAVCAAPRGPIFFAAAFDAVRLGVRAVHAAVLGGEVRGPALEALAFHVGARVRGGGGGAGSARWACGSPRVGRRPRRRPTRVL